MEKYRIALSSPAALEAFQKAIKEGEEDFLNEENLKTPVKNNAALKVNDSMMQAFEKAIFSK